MSQKCSLLSPCAYIDSIERLLARMLERAEEQAEDTQSVEVLFQKLIALDAPNED